MKIKQSGFTLYELLIVVAAVVMFVVVFVAGIYGTLLTGNFWYTEAGVLRELRFDHPSVEQVLKTTRNVWDYSEIIVEEGGVRKIYFLDTNILWNYDFSE